MMAEVLTVSEHQPPERANAWSKRFPPFVGRRGTLQPDPCRLRSCLFFHEGRHDPGALRDVPLACSASGVATRKTANRSKRKRSSRFMRHAATINSTSPPCVAPALDGSMKCSSNLRDKLAAEGLFSGERKRILPHFPRPYRHRHIAPGGGTARCHCRFRPARRTR